MKFDKLFKIVTEGKGSKKNRGGGILHNAKESEGPVELPGSSAGFASNPQLRAPSKRWEFNRNAGGDTPPDELSDASTGEAISLIKSKKGAGEGFKEQSKLWRNMLSTVGLLLNDKEFNKKFHEIADTFGKSLDSFRHLRDNEEGEKEKYDEEAKLDALDRIVDKYAGEATTLRSDLQNMMRLKDKVIADNADQDNIVTEIGAVDGKIKAIKSLLAKSGKSKNANPQKTAELERQLSELENQSYDLSTRLTSSKLTPSVYDSQITKLQSDLAMKEEQEKEKRAELKTLNDRISKINSTNENANGLALDEFMDLIKTTARSLADQHTSKLGEKKLTNLADLNWDDINSTKLAENVAKLEALTSDDPSINPLVKYLDRFKRNYEDREFNISHALDKNTNITKIRDRNRLPFMILSNMYSNMNLRKPITIDYGIENPDHKRAIWNLEKFLMDHTHDSPVNAKKWGLATDWMINHIKNLALPEQVKDALIDKASAEYSLSKSGANSFKQLQSSVNSDLSRYKTHKESFDQTLANILKEQRYDDDDFKIDTIEVLNSIRRSKY